MLYRPLASYGTPTKLASLMSTLVNSKSSFSSKEGVQAWLEGTMQPSIDQLSTDQYFPDLVQMIYAALHYRTHNIFQTSGFFLLFSIAY